MPFLMDCNRGLRSSQKNIIMLLEAILEFSALSLIVQGLGQCYMPTVVFTGGNEKWNKHAER